MRLNCVRLTSSITALLTVAIVAIVAFDSGRSHVVTVEVTVGG